MSVRIETHLITTNNKGKKGQNHPTYIVIHDTGNKSDTANAMNHYKWLQGNENTGASAHVFVDDHMAVQVIEYDTPAWHTGKRYLPYPKVPECTNLNSIGVEFCVNKGSDLEKTLEHTAEVIALLMNEYRIPLDKVITHQMSSGKECPRTFIEHPEYFKQLRERLQIVPAHSQAYEAIAFLASETVLNSADYWLKHLKDIPYLEELFINMAHVIHAYKERT